MQEWFQRYDICCRANGWNAAAQALKLPTLLEGEALAIWLELTEEEQTNYGIMKKKLISTMIPMEFVSLDEFHRRKLRPSESLSIYVHDLKKLLDQAMPGLEKKYPATSYYCIRFWLVFPRQLVDSYERPERLRN